jgi:membrane-anchored glycerophosphoryl diester phosphodiesterase (GDPDase)
MVGIALALIVIPLLTLLILAGVVGIPVEGQQPPPSFALFIALVAIASLFISVKFTMAVPISIGEEPGPLEILKRSWRLTRGHYWRLLAFIVLLLVTTVILMLAAQSVGGIAVQLIGGRIAPLTLGALVLALMQSVVSASVTTLFAVMLARIYLQIAGRGEAQASAPSSGI